MARASFLSFLLPLKKWFDMLRAQFVIPHGHTTKTYVTNSLSYHRPRSLFYKKATEQLVLVVLTGLPFSQVFFFSVYLFHETEKLFGQIYS